MVSRHDPLCFPHELLMSLRSAIEYHSEYDLLIYSLYCGVQYYGTCWWTCNDSGDEDGNHYGDDGDHDGYHCDDKIKMKMVVMLMMVIMIVYIMVMTWLKWRW